MGSVLIAAVGWAGEPAVTLEFIAHAAFRVVAEDSSSLIIDPYADRVWLCSSGVTRPLGRQRAAGRGALEMIGRTIGHY